MESGGKDLAQAGEDPDERLLHVVDGGEEVHRLAQLVRVRLLHQLHTKKNMVSTLKGQSHKMDRPVVYITHSSRTREVGAGFIIFPRLLFIKKIKISSGYCQTNGGLLMPVSL